MTDYQTLVEENKLLKALVEHYKKVNEKLIEENLELYNKLDKMLEKGE